MLKNATLQKLESSKNLLAFSGGGDSTALLFLLLDNNVKFDIAIVDYQVRDQSKKEVAYAKELANKHDFKCHVLLASVPESNFEANARMVRYDFFNELIKEYEYDNLLTAHHLGDRFEWTLMQFCKGAGCVELSGMKEFEKRDRYNLLRPLLGHEKSELLSYLNANNLKYFEDESNLDEKYQRNYFRANHSKPLLEKYASGIKKSFQYMDEDVNDLVEDSHIEELEEFAYFKASKSKRGDVVSIDRHLKAKGCLMGANEKKLLREVKTIVVSRKFVVNQEHGFVFIAPYVLAKEMPKEFKEKMRLLKIEPKLRGYLHKRENAKELIIGLLSPSRSNL